MSWYKTGTIGVTNGSAAVTGSGTAWVANAQAGEAILCPDGKFWEILSVNSDTSLTLAANYSGTTQSGQAYTILPSQSFIRDLANQTATLINSYATIANNAGAGKFGDGTISAPGICFVNDTDTGIRRTASGTFALVSNGADVLSVAPAGVSITGTASISGMLTSNSGSIIANNSTAGQSSYILFRNAGSANFNIQRDGSNNLKFNHNESGSSTVFTLSTTGAAVTGTLSAAVALNSASGLTVTNSSAGDGSLSQARVSTINNAGTTGYMTTMGSAFTTSGVFSAGNTYFGASAGNTYVHSAGGTVNLSVGTAAILSASGTGVTITQVDNQAALKLTNGPSANNIGLTLESSGGNVVINNGNGPLEVSVGGSLRLNVATNGDFYGVAGTTGMTGGFIHVPSAAGAPIGAPTAHSGRTPIYYDTTNNKLYAYNGAWKASGVFA